MSQFLEFLRYDFKTKQSFRQEEYLMIILGYRIYVYKCPLTDKCHQSLFLAPALAKCNIGVRFSVHP